MKTIWKVLAGILLILVVTILTLLNTRSSVTVERVLNAPVDKVWAAWNDPETIKKWWGPTGYSCPTATNDPRVGGSYLLGMQGPDGKVVYNVGTYTEFVPSKKMVSKLYFADEDGKPVPASQYGLPGSWPEFVIVSVEFTEGDGKTTVKITEEGIPAIMKLFAKMGWEQQFEKFDVILAGP